MSYEPSLRYKTLPHLVRAQICSMSKQKIKAKSFVLVGRACTRQARRSVRRIQAEDWLLCDGDDRPLKERDEPDVDEQRQEVEHVR